MPDALPPVLRSARLRLRPFKQDYAPALFRIFSDDEVVRFWSVGAWTELAQAQTMIAEAMAAYREGGLCRYAIALADSSGFQASRPAGDHRRARLCKLRE